ncbi:MAG: hypothetical protein QOI98_1136 [Solirubrobacteraceae bacterium]|jgi:hypothetical protein|nr:hypothetical protein [Solirubrobacteraceae bacterium]
MRRSALVLASLLALTAAAAVAQAQQATPTVTTGGATSVKQHSAVLNGTVRPNGANTTWYFQYGTTTAYGNHTNNRTVAAGQGTQSVSRTINGLVSGTKYHYRIVANNSSGTSAGVDKTFTTTGSPPVVVGVSLAASPNPATFGHSTKLTGQVAGPASGGSVVTLQAKPYPYTGAFAQVGNSVIASSSGAFSFTDSPLLNTQYRVVARKGGTTLVSPTVLERVRISVSTNISDTTPRAGQKVRFSGSVKPPHVGATVRVQRRTSTGKYVTIAKAHVHAVSATRGSYSIRVRISKTGYYKVRVSTPDLDHSSGVGKRRHLRVH